jgi:hypothetical protein
MGALFSLISLSLTRAFFTISTSVRDDKSTLIHFSPKPAVVTIRKHCNRKETDADDGIEHVSLRHLVEARCKSLFTGFRPLWYLFKYVASYYPQSVYLITDLVNQYEVGIYKLCIAYLAISRR